jgi:macrolide-specific efflux system membrane fusion protein
MNDTASPAGHRRKSSKGRRRALIAAVVVAAAGTWYGVHTYRANKAAKENEYIFATIDRNDIEDLVSSTGTLQPRDYVDVGAQVSGQIDDIFVEVGDVVEEGQKLVTIDATTSQARVDANRASMESAKTNLLSQIANRDKAKRDYERQKNLYEAKATTYEQLINAQTTYENAERSVKTSQLSIDQNEANQRIEAKNLQYTTITAPIAGTVMKLSVKKGQTVNASQTVPNVLQIANLGTMTVQADVSEADYQRLSKGTPVYFTTLGGNGHRWYSQLKRIEPTPKVTQSVVTYNALFDIENDDKSLTPGMTTQVYFVVNEALNVVRVPMAALQQGQQISRQIAEKERKEGKAPANGAGGPGIPGAMGSGIPGAPSGPGATSAPAPGAASTTAAATAPAGNAPAAAATQGNAPARPDGGAAPANRQANGNVPNGGFGGQRPGGNGQGGFGGQRGGGAGGGFGGQRPGGQGGFGGGQRGGGAGGFGGADFQNMTNEQREEMRRRFQQNGGGNFAGRGGNFQGGGNFNRQGGAAGAAAGRPAQVQRRTGTVMVKKADGTLETRRIVYGVSDRVFAEVIDGLKEGEQVVVGKHETEAAAAAPRTNTNNNNNQNFNQQGRGGNFQGGGGFGGGGGRPF